MFKEILEHDSAISAAEQQANAKAVFPKLVLRSGFLKLYNPAVELDCNSLIIGLATYSVEDLKILDDILIAKDNFDDKKLYIYDVSQSESMDDLNKIFPNLGNVFQTPILSTFNKEAKSIWGFDARARLNELLIK